MKLNFVKYLTIVVLMITLSVTIGSIAPNFATQASQNTNNSGSTNSVTKVTSTTYITHSSISVSGNNYFTSAGFTGNGSRSNPYVLEGYSVTSTSGDAIVISGTTAYFVIKNCYISNNGTNFYALVITLASNGIISNNIIKDSSIGIEFTGGSSNITIANNTITNSADYGIESTSTNLLNIYNNTITKSQYSGLNEFSDSNSSITYNNISYNDLSNASTDYGIIDEAVSANITYSHNIVDHNGNDGIWLYAYGPQTVTYNTVEFNQGNGIYFGFGGPEGVINVSYNLVAYNLADGLNLDHADNNSITNNIIFQNGGNGVNVGSTNINNYFFNNNITANTLDGFLIDGSSANVTVKGNTLVSNNYGLYLNSSNGVYASNSTFVNNTINLSTNNGIYISRNSNNTFYYNVISESGSYGMNVLNSLNNKIYLNSFINNNPVYGAAPTANSQSFSKPTSLTTSYNVQASDENTTNMWTNGHFGNYYTGYTGQDLNGDSIGDSNYTLDGGAFANDTLPLMDPVTFTFQKPADFSFNEGIITPLYLKVLTYDSIVYVLYQNNTKVATTTISGSQYNKTSAYIDSSLSAGVYKYDYVLTDVNTSLVFSFSVIVTVKDVTAPVLTVSATSITYEVGTTGHTISVKASDLHPSHYILYENGTQKVSGSWNSSVNITVSVDGLSVGSYNFTLVVFDLSNNQAQVTVMVTVTSPVTQNPSSKSVTSTQSSNTNNSSGTNPSSSTSNKSKGSPSFEIFMAILSLSGFAGVYMKRRKH